MNVKDTYFIPWKTTNDIRSFIVSEYLMAAENALIRPNTPNPTTTLLWKSHTISGAIRNNWKSMASCCSCGAHWSLKENQF